jgi:ComF family protein
MRRQLLDLLLPPACAACGRSGALLCRACLTAFEAPSRPEDRFVAPDAGIVIGDALVIGIAAFAHAGSVRRALAALKYSGASRLAPTLAGAATPALTRLLEVSGAAALVPVPVHRERQRVRGYNQAALIGHELAGTASQPFADVLERTRPTTKQHRLDRAARLANLRGAFAMRAGASVPAKVIVVDDIITTNATLEACASVLVAAGAREVYGFAVAREI